MGGAPAPGYEGRVRPSIFAPIAFVLAACSTGSAAAPRPVDGGAEVSSGSATGSDASVTDGATETGTVDASPLDALTTTSALVRLANWSPDAYGIDFCVSPHASATWSGPLLGAALGNTVVGRVTITDAAVVIDSSTPHLRDSGNAAQDASDSGADATSDAGVHDGSSAHDGAQGPQTGVIFPRVSPYLSLSPGQYDLRVVAAGSPDCTVPLFAEVDDLAALRAGAVVTFAAVGDAIDQGSDPALSLAILGDDTMVASTAVSMRFVNAIPSVTGVTFLSGTIATGNAVPYFSATQFGAAGIDTDAGAVDSNGYVTIAPITTKIWSLVNANGGVATLVGVENVSVPAARLATVVGIGGESGANAAAIGILLCTDEAPIVAGETASCDLFQGNVGGVCPSCP